MDVARRITGVGDLGAAGIDDILHPAGSIVGVAQLRQGLCVGLVGVNGLIDLPDVTKGSVGISDSGGTARYCTKLA